MLERSRFTRVAAHSRKWKRLFNWSARQADGPSLAPLPAPGAEGLAVSEIMAATGSRNRGATDTLLFKMREGGEINRVKRGIYALSQDAGKISKKERNGHQVTESIDEIGNLTDLTD